LTKDEAFDKLAETVEKVGSGTFQSDEQAFVVAAQALNFIMDNVKEDDGSENSTSD
jgi:hypothetical protein